jgi:hypothetical protein
VNVAEDKTNKEPTLVERWLQDQQQWQRTILSYLDSMVKDEDFLVHLGNAMRGSLLAGKPYPRTAAAGTPDQETPADDRLDRVLFALHQLQGQLQDVALTLDEIRQDLNRGGKNAPSRPSRSKAPAPKARKRRSTG